MTISTYSAYSTEVQDWLHRSDLSGKVSTATQMLEDELNRKLRCRQMLANTVLTANTDTIALPGDYLELRNLQLMAGNNPPLVYVTPEQMDGYDRGTSTGQPRIYTIYGNNIVIRPQPDQTYSIACSYYQKIPSLESATTNWLLTQYPTAYLSGGIYYLRAYTQDADLVQWAKATYEEIVADINRADDNASYSGSAIRIRSDVVR